MGKLRIGVNLEFVRDEDKTFEWGVEKAAQIGYDFVEPMVHWGRELLSEAGYFHSVSMLDDPYRVKRACEKAGIGLSGLSAHCPLCEPEISPERQAILACVTAALGPMTPKAIADATGRSPDAIRQLLGKMLGDRQVAKTAASEYYIPSTTDHTGHSDHSTQDSHTDHDNTPENDGCDQTPSSTNHSEVHVKVANNQQLNISKRGA